MTMLQLLWLVVGVIARADPRQVNTLGENRYH